MKNGMGGNTGRGNGDRPLLAADKGQAFTGGLRGGIETAAESPLPVRNDVAQAGDEVVALRHFKIKKGGFEAFYGASVTGVWPYFEKMGARIIGMWKVVHPTVDGKAAGTDSPDHDDVYLVTRYASLDHWKMTRETVKHGGNGPDWDACREALGVRRDLTLDTSVSFLQGHKWDSAPWYMPGLDEGYEPVGK